MLKYLKTLGTISMLALTVGAASAASISVPEGGNEWYQMMWSSARMKAMDKNADGRVSRQEFMDYMSAQFDKMDQNKDKMLSAQEFMDRKMMMSTFPTGSLPE